MSPTPTPAGRTDHRKHEREEGAVLLMVVMILMVVTATAVYAVHATASELSGAGSSRTAYQTEMAATSLLEGTLDWINRFEPDPLFKWIHSENVAGRRLDLTNSDLVPMNPTMDGKRFDLGDLNKLRDGTTTIDLTGAGNLNNGVPQILDATIDAYDIHLFGGDIAGARSDGYGGFSYVRWTWTARARSHVEVAPGASQIIQDRHVTTATARGTFTSGPISN